MDFIYNKKIPLVLGAVKRSGTRSGLNMCFFGNVCCLAGIIKYKDKSYFLNLK